MDRRLDDVSHGPKAHVTVMMLALTLVSRIRQLALAAEGGMVTDLCKQESPRQAMLRMRSKANCQRPCNLASDGFP